MGCSSSTPVGDDTGAPRPAKQNVDPEKLEIPEVTWERDEGWSHWICAKEQQLIDSGRQNELPWLYQELMFNGARAYLATRYPECDRNGTIEDMGDCHICMGAGDCSGNDKCKSPTKTYLVLDASFTGIVHSLALVVAKPPQKPTDDQQPWLVPGSELESDEIAGAKHTVLQRLALMRADSINLKHTLINIFIGADLITCRFDASAKPPTINPCKEVWPKLLIETLNSMQKDTKKAPNAFRGLFAPCWFRQTVRAATNGFEGSTVWDEGPLPFKLPNGSMYHEPTRILVTRVYENTTERVEEIPFTATPPPFPGDDESESVTLVRKADPTKEPGGIVRIALIIGISKSIVWPKLGDYIKTSTMRAGERAAMEYATTLYAKGVLERCTIRVYMGTDETVFKFVGDPKSLFPEVRALPGPHDLAIQSDPTTQDPVMDGSLEKDFNLKVSLLPKHDLMGSESQFQAVKKYVAEKAKTKLPDELRAQLIMVAHMTAQMFLTTNFPECEVSDEGPFPVVQPDGTMTLDLDTRLMVARDDKQEVVAAMNIVPYPGPEASLFGDKNWLDTPEMKEADDRLLRLLKKWYAEGKVSKVDCMAQTMMVKDATIYKFVDGERFEDYSEERMKQFTWG
ncbi:hypothetical protein FAUST_6353 [Fusarium austroamericanum]|uniref:Uncharacterized protein n=1 Tax=Fusarium austroamericanum TaxID=282268 RepID=A0AAN5Z9H9_FUSAU|nr:hypothetical protein FAUST_6353 [Fusarium austroamericanum]